MTIKVNNSFYDCGFDPRFSFDGNIFYKKSLNENLKEKFNHVILIFKSHFSPSSEKRKIYKAVLKCAKMEKALSEVDRRWVVKSKNEKDWFCVQKHLFKEYEFFEGSSQLCKMLLYERDAEVPKRLFPIEILQPIHKINKPQTSRWNKEQVITNDSENGDLDRIPMFGFYELCHHFTPNVRHKEFIEDIDESADHLKTAVRRWRVFIHQSAYQKQKEYSLWKQQLAIEMQHLEEAWSEYASSHRLVKRANKKFGDQDIFRKYYYQISKDGRGDKYWDRALKKARKLFHAKLAAE